jgi:hypothetical protein
MILKSVSPYFVWPTDHISAQELIRSALSDLRSLNSRITTLSLFSSNEALEDVSTRDLVYLLVPFVSAELEGRVKAPERDERLIHLGMAQRYLRTFVETLDNYEIVPATERELREKSTLDIRDPAKRRELKIKQYQKEKELRTRIEVFDGCLLSPIVANFCASLGHKKASWTTTSVGCWHNRFRLDLITPTIVIFRSRRRRRPRDRRYSSRNHTFAFTINICAGPWTIGEHGSRIRASAICASTAALCRTSYRRREE